MSRNIFSLKLLFAPAVLVDMSRIALPKNPQHRLYLPVFGARPSLLAAGCALHREHLFLKFTAFAGAWVALFLALALFAASVVVDVLSNKNVVVRPRPYPTNNAPDTPLRSRLRSGFRHPFAPSPTTSHSSPDILTLRRTSAASRTSTS